MRTQCRVEAWPSPLTAHQQICVNTLSGTGFVSLFDCLFVGERLLIGYNNIACGSRSWSITLM